MFDGQKQKLDPKVRFQRRTFTEKLKAAQQYKRSVRKAPETEQEKLLSGLGLDSWWSRIAVAAGIVGLIYLAYIPNFLFVSKIEFQGTSDQDSIRLTSSVREYFRESPMYLPQRNVLFLSSSKLSEYLVQKNPQVRSVIKVTRDLGKVTVAVEMKTERFEVITGTHDVAVYNDGVVSRDLSATPPEQKQQFIKVQTTATEQVSVGKPYLSEQLADALLNVHQVFPINKRINFSHFVLPVADQGRQEIEAGDGLDQAPEVLENSPLAALVPNEFIVYAVPASNVKVRPFKAIFDASTETKTVVAQFTALLTQLPPEKLNDLEYIDMRFPDRSFVCLASAPCALEAFGQQLESSVEESADTAE